MATGAQLKDMAKERLAEAQLLFDNRLYAGAYYLAGYAIEFGLKSIICKKLGVDIFEEGRVQGYLSRSAVKTFQIHDIPALVLLSGLQSELEIRKTTDSEFQKTWNVISAWTEQRRYEYGCNMHTAARFLKRVKEFVQWIETYW